MRMVIAPVSFSFYGKRKRCKREYNARMWWVCVVIRPAAGREDLAFAAPRVHACMMRGLRLAGSPWPRKLSGLVMTNWFGRFQMLSALATPT